MVVNRNNINTLALSPWNTTQVVTYKWVRSLPSITYTDQPMEVMVTKREQQAITRTLQNKNLKH